MKLEEIFDAFTGLKVLVVGDVMIDSYIWGTVERISPEAPVPVVNVKRRENRLGGAGNVALNLQALGATPLLCSVIGDDEAGNELEKLLTQRHMSTHGLIRAKNRPTTIKHRILAGSQQLLRIDSESTENISEQSSQALLAHIEHIIHQIDVIIFEDYDKGVLHAQNINAIISLANAKNIPTAVDPKKRNFFAYQNCSLFKPNLKELREGIDKNVESTTESLQQGVQELRKKLACDKVMITLSENGVFINDSVEQHLLAAHKREIADVSGAGDTVISIAALCLALRTDLRFLAALSNLGGGLVCEQLGVVPIDAQLLKKEAQRILADL